VLSGGGTAWDSFHVCDPSVVRVDVTYGGTPYSYAMFYLGNDADCSCHNQIGVALLDGTRRPMGQIPEPGHRVRRHEADIRLGRGTAQRDHRRRGGRHGRPHLELGLHGGPRRHQGLLRAGLLRQRRTGRQRHAPDPDDRSDGSERRPRLPQQLRHRVLLDPRHLLHGA
jgi:hypothetical protein